MYINCGPQNRWFNLLTVGGAESGQNVVGLGIIDAAAITFFSLNNFIQPNSQYADAREGAIASAEILFGNCSFEVEQTTNAWAAVNVGAAFDNTCMEVTGPSLICAEYPGFPFTYEASVPDGVTVNWSNVPGSWSVLVSGVGNRLLTVNGINGYPSTEDEDNFFFTISSSAGGGSAIFLNIILCEDCHGTGQSCLERPNEAQVEVPDGVDSDIYSSPISLFSNPAVSTITVRDNGNVKDGHIEILSIEGRFIATFQQVLQATTIDISNLKPGIYMVRKTGDVAVESVRLIKQ